MDGGPAGLTGCVVVVTTSRARGEALAGVCHRHGLSARVCQPRGTLPVDASVLVLDLTTSVDAVASFATRVASPDLHVVAVADGAEVDDGTTAELDRVDSWVDARQSLDELLAAVDGRTVRSQPSDPRRPADPALTARERQVLEELLVGDGTPSMAVRLGISEHTVRKHVQNVLEKVGVRSRAEAAAWAIGQGLAPAESAEGVGP